MLRLLVHLQRCPSLHLAPIAALLVVTSLAPKEVSDLKILLIIPNSESRKVKFASRSVGASVASVKFAFAILAFSIPADVACKSLCDVTRMSFPGKLGKNVCVHIPPEIAVKELLVQ